MSNRIREARKAKGITLEALGNLVGKKKNTVSRYENGLIEPNLETWVKLANALDVSVMYLQGIDDDYWYLTDLLSSITGIDLETVKSIVAETDNSDNSSDSQQRWIALTRVLEGDSDNTYPAEVGRQLLQMIQQPHVIDDPHGLDNEDKIYIRTQAAILRALFDIGTLIDQEEGD